METLKILDSKDKLNWLYDEEGDVLYISIDEPKPSVGIDVGEGLILRYDESTGKVTGLTIIGLRDRSVSAMNKKKTRATRKNL